MTRRSKSLISLSSEQRALLLEVLNSRAPDMVPILDESRDITEAERLALTLVISEEFTASGLRPEDGPNDRGFSLESLLDAVNRLTDEFDAPQ